MYLNDYQKFTETTAIYPVHVDIEGKYVYLPLGLADEAGELAEKVSAFTSRLTTQQDGPKPSEILKEIGDVAWYCARLADEYQCPLESLDGVAYLGPATVDHLALEICAKAGFIAGRSKKLLRDGLSWKNEQIDENVVKPQLKAISEILAALRTLCRFFGTDLHKVLYENRRKLLSRQDRGVLQGNGDNR